MKQKIECRACTGTGNRANPVHSEDCAGSGKKVGDPSGHRVPRVLVLLLLSLVVVRVLVGSATFEHIWIGLSAALFGGLVTMNVRVFVRLICFGEAHVRAWLSQSSGRGHALHFALGALIAVGIYYHFR